MKDFIDHALLSVCLLATLLSLFWLGDVLFNNDRYFGKAASWLDGLNRAVEHHQRN